MWRTTGSLQGDQVPHRKLQVKWTGPHVVLRVADFFPSFLEADFFPLTKNANWPEYIVDTPEIVWSQK